MNPTRRWFVKAFSGAILTTLLGVKAWRLEEEGALPSYWIAGEDLRPGDILSLDDDGRIVNARRFVENRTLSGVQIRDIRMLVVRHPPEA